MGILNIISNYDGNEDELASSNKFKSPYLYQATWKHDYCDGDYKSYNLFY